MRNEFEALEKKSEAFLSYLSREETLLKGALKAQTRKISDFKLLVKKYTLKEVSAFSKANH